MWTQEEIDLLRKIYPRPEYTAAELAEDLGRTRNAVFLKACRLGVKKEEIKWE